MRRFFSITAIVFLCITIFMISAAGSQPGLTRERETGFASANVHASYLSYLTITNSDIYENSTLPVMSKLFFHRSHSPFELPFYSISSEYGEQVVIIRNEPPLLSYIRYPAVDYFANSIISYWANSEYANAVNMLSLIRLDDDNAYGEIYITYDSYITQERFVGILGKGMSKFTGMEQPDVILNVFNFDIKYEIILENEHIIDLTRYEDVLMLLFRKVVSAYPHMSWSLNDIDGSWLSNLVIGHERIYFVIEKGMHFPGQIGILSIPLTFSELGDLLILHNNQAYDEVDENDPTGVSGVFIDTTGVPIRSSIDPSRPMVALTFDDGPSMHTIPILETLERYNSLATFFVIGELVERRPEIVIQAFEEGHEILGHSWTHRRLTTMSDAEIKNEIVKTNDVIEAITGFTPNMIRTPFGLVNSRVQSIARETGVAIINWSVDPQDWRLRDADAIYNAIMRSVHDRAIILCHDLRAPTAEAMERVIPSLVERGYQLVTVSELMYFSGKELVPGQVYHSGL